MIWGRNVYDCIAKFLQFQLTANLSAAVVSVISAALIGVWKRSISRLLFASLTDVRYLDYSTTRCANALGESGHGYISIIGTGHRTTDWRNLESKTIRSHEIAHFTDNVAKYYRPRDLSTDGHVQYSLCRAVLFGCWVVREQDSGWSACCARTKRTIHFRVQCLRADDPFQRDQRTKTTRRAKRLQRTVSQSFLLWDLVVVLCLTSKEKFIAIESSSLHEQWCFRFSSSPSVHAYSHAPDWIFINGHGVYFSVLAHSFGNRFDPSVESLLRKRLLRFSRLFSVFPPNRSACAFRPFIVSVARVVTRNNHSKKLKRKR